MFATLLTAAMAARALMGEPQKDAPLMERVRAGDEQAFAEIVSAHQSEVARYCARFLGDVEVARDVTQEVFVTLWKGRERYRESGKLRHFLLRIARNRCLALTKKRSVRRNLTERWRLPTELPKTKEPSMARDLDRALGALKPEARDLVILRHLEELDLAEIAEVTGLKLGTVKSRLSRAMGALQREFARG